MPEQINPFVMSNEKLIEHHRFHWSEHRDRPVWGCPTCIAARGKLRDSRFPPLPVDELEIALVFAEKNKIIETLQLRLDDAEDEIEELQEQVDKARKALG